MTRLGIALALLGIVLIDVLLIWYFDRHFEDHEERG